jgi:hypothetical protein
VPPGYLRKGTPRRPGAPPAPRRHAGRPVGRGKCPIVQRHRAEG